MFNLIQVNKVEKHLPIGMVEFRVSDRDLFQQSSLDGSEFPYLKSLEKIMLMLTTLREMMIQSGVGDNVTITNFRDFDRDKGPYTRIRFQDMTVKQGWCYVLEFTRFEIGPNYKVNSIWKSRGDKGENGQDREIIL